MDGSQFLDVQRSSGGGPQGPLLLGPLFLPAALGQVFVTSDNRWFRLSLKANADGSTWYDENNKPTLELVELVP